MRKGGKGVEKVSAACEKVSNLDRLSDDQLEKFMARAWRIEYEGDLYHVVMKSRISAVDSAL